jgi:teichuronic acid biosynthesis glycosyltransferase TuaC
MSSPRILVFSSLFPNKVYPTAGNFIKERMFRVALQMPIMVIAPQAWSPIDWAIRVVRPNFRLLAEEFEIVDGIEIYRPKCFSFPGFFKKLDSFFMARGSRKIFYKSVATFKPTVVDAHFAYPDGHAASILALESNLPLFITLRGSKDKWLLGTSRQELIKEALDRARTIISVSQELIDTVAVPLGQPVEKTVMIGNGVDTSKFKPIEKSAARQALNLPTDAKIIIGVGNLIESKGFHRVIPMLINLRKKHGDVRYLIVGPNGSHGDMSGALKSMASDLGLSEAVVFYGRQPHEKLNEFYSAADAFVLATEYEGWANVFLEAMACGLPVISTLVGGNAQVVSDSKFGTLTPFFDPESFELAIDEALEKKWNGDAIRSYALSNDWSARVEVLCREFSKTA